MSNTTFKSVKNVREPFSSLSATEGTIFGDYNRIFPKFIFSPFVDYTNLKSIKLQTDGSSNTLKDSSGTNWSPGKVYIVAAELKTDNLNTNSPNLRVSSSGPIIISSIVADDAKSEGVRVFAVDSPLSTAGNPPFIELPSTRTLIFDGNGLTSGSKAYVTIYYHE